MNRLREQHDLTPLVIHDSYLINLAAPPSVIREKSIDGFRGELERALLIGADYLVTHPGNYKGMTVEQGMLNVAEAIALAWRGVDPALKTNAETDASCSKTRPEQARSSAESWTNYPPSAQLAGPYLDIPVGYCLDTCHCYVSGFDIAQETGLIEAARMRDGNARPGARAVSFIPTMPKPL